jgi:hypothetical protein
MTAVHTTSKRMLIFRYRTSFDKGPRAKFGDLEELESAQESADLFDQKRRAERFDYTMPLYAQMLELDFTPIGEAFKVSAQNNSTGGMAIAHDKAVDSGRLIGLQLSRADGKVIKIVMRVIRCITIEGGFEIAGRFVTRLT